MTVLAKGKASMSRACQVCIGNLTGVKRYLADRGSINATLDAMDLSTLQKELGGDCRQGNPAVRGHIGAVEVGDTALHIAVRHRNKAMVQYLLAHGAEVHIENSCHETAISLGAEHFIDVRSNFKIEGRLVEIFDILDENKDGFVNEAEVIKFGLLTSDNDEENTYAFWQGLDKVPGQHGEPLVAKKAWVNYFLQKFSSTQVMTALAQLQEVLDNVMRIKGQAIGQSLLSSRTTPLRTIHHQHWVSSIRKSWSPADRRVTAESYRPRSAGHPFVPLYF